MQVAKSKYWYQVKRIIPNSVYEPILSTLYNIRSIGYNGNSVFCPVCENKFSRFVADHNCPKCGSARIHRLLYLFLKEETDFFSKRLRVLHFAPEHCFFKKFKSLPNIEYVAADISSPRASVKVDMTSIQFPDNYFDVVLSSHVLEHIDDDKLAMSELYRVMKPGGWSIHQVPIEYSREETLEDPAITTNAERLEVYGHIDHKRIYGRDYKDRLAWAGFIVTPRHFAATLSEKHRQKVMVDYEELIYLCKKRVNVS